MTELSDLQHKYSEVSKVANEKRNLAENQLRTLRVAVETLKAEKQRMIKRMKEDAERIKEMNAANDREIQALRRSEKAALDGRKKAEREIEQAQQRVNAMLHRNTDSGPSQQARVIGFLKKPQTPKGITKAPKRAPRAGPSDRHDSRTSSIPTPKVKAQGSTRLLVSQKKQVIDRAIYGYISGQHAINVMEDMLKKRERLRTEKLELEQERQRVVQAQEENAIANGGLLLDFASEPQYMDDRLTMIDAEIAYINARIRALQAEAAALGFVTTIERNGHLDEDAHENGTTTSDEEELMTRLIRQGMADDAMGLPPGSGATVAFESSISILRSMDLNESREFLEMLFEDMVNVRTHENGLQVQVANQEKVIEELKRALQAMRQAAVGATLGYEKRCDGLEQKLRQLGGSTDDLNAASGHVDGSSEEDENDAEVARLSRAAFTEEGMTSPVPGIDGSKDRLWTPLPDSARPRPGSVAEAVLDVKAKRTSTIFDQLYEDAMKTSEETSPKVGGTGGEFSRILMANNERRVSWAGIPATATEDLAARATQDQEQPHRLSRSISTSAIGNRTVDARVDPRTKNNTSMYGHRRGGSSSGGSSGGQAIGVARSASSMNRLPSAGSDTYQKGIYASTASSRQHAETIAARRSSTPLSSPAIGPKSTARPRHNSGYSSNAEGPLPSPTQHHPRHGGAPLTIQTGFANGHVPQHTLRHAKSHQQVLNSQRQSYDSRRASTPSPGLVGKRLSRSDSDGGGLAGRSQNGSGRPLSRIGATSMMTTTATATNMVSGMASPALPNGHSAADASFGYIHPHHPHYQHHHSNSGEQHYHTHHHNNSASRRISGSWDDNQNVYERLASVHTQASQARLLATRNTAHASSSPAMGPAGGSMMTSTGNLVSPGFQQIQQHQQQQQSKGYGDRQRLHRPSVDGLMGFVPSNTSVNGAKVGAANPGMGGDDGSHHVQGERWSSNSSSSVTSASSTASTMTAATNSPTAMNEAEQQHERMRESIQPLMSKSEVGPVF